MAAPGLREALLLLEQRYQGARGLAADPISVPLAWTDPMDREVAAWVAAHLAYGRVAPMIRAIQGVMAPLGPHPAQWLRERPPETAARALRRALQGWVWRFHTAEDMVQWLLAWQRLDRETAGQGLEPLLLPTPELPLDAALGRLVQRLRRELPPGPGLRFSLPDPAEGGACKRWRMFLRWMVRPGWPDLGLWTRLSPADLVIPLDTHVAQAARRLGLSHRKQPDGRMAHQVTEALRALDPEDPLRFDFALSHLGILGDCLGRWELTVCQACPLKGHCHEGKGGSSSTQM